MKLTRDGDFSEHDGYQIRLDVSDIIRDVEKAVDKAGEL